MQYILIVGLPRDLQGLEEKICEREIDADVAPFSYFIPIGEGASSSPLGPLNALSVGKPHAEAPQPPPASTSNKICSQCPVSYV